jgi:hypothetical protein
MQKDFYSAEYFNVIDDVFSIKETSLCLVNTIENFFDFIEAQNTVDYTVDKDMMIDYAGLDNNYTHPKLVA